ncbi:MAG: TfoX/Sxy family protein, partial [Chloroflexi bacterium]|nr:TfoX/Sxy family protein [Chloroflexota bacterium]
MGLGEKIILVAGPLLFIDSFLRWYNFSFEGLGISLSVSRSGWQSPGAIWSILAVLIGLVMFGLIAADTLYLKVDDETRGDYQAAGAGPFLYTRKGREIALSQRLLSLPMVGECVFRPSVGRIRRMLRMLIR